MTISELKRHFRHITSETLPHHWLQSWLKFVIAQDDVFLMVHDDYVLSDDELSRLHEGIDKMSQGTPLAYLMGRQAFFGHEFMVNEYTLIPRPDTEILVQTVLDFVVHQPKGRILDLGTGSGCIAVSLAKALPDWLIMGVDKSPQALSVASQNAHALGADNVTLVQSDWFSAVAGKWHVIVSNPPYIAKDDEHLSALTAEPITALVADEAGLSDIAIIIDGATTRLERGGSLLIEHGHAQACDVQRLFEQAGFGQVKTIKDYGNNDRVTMGVWHG